MVRQRQRRSPIPRLPRLTQKQILAWADKYYERMGGWPGEKSGLIAGTNGETWGHLSKALRQGNRGLTGGSSLVRLLERRRGYLNRSNLPPLTEDEILAWAELHRRCEGKWPTARSGRVLGAPDETWTGIDGALKGGFRALPGGLSLARLLEERCGYRNSANLLRLTIKQILAWADSHHERTGKWPTRKGGPIPEATGETWETVHRALKHGHRGLRGELSIPRLLAKYRGVSNRKALPQLTTWQILRWADAHRKRTGEWPHQNSGAVLGAKGESWGNLDGALRHGHRGLAGGSTVWQLLGEYLGVRNAGNLTRLTKRQIFAWAQAHYRRTGRWPGRASGELPDAPGEKWQNLDAALHRGSRGLPGGSSLPQFLAERRRLRFRG